MKALVNTSYNYYKKLGSFDTPGTYSLTIPETREYLVSMYGSGGGSAANYHSYNSSYYAYYTVGGGSGAGFRGFLYLNAGTYSVTIGTHGSNGAGAASGGTSQGSDGTATIFGSIISAGGGTGAYISGGASKVIREGVGGTLSILDSSKITRAEISSSGLDGGRGVTTGVSYPPSVATYYPICWGGMSLYDGTYMGYGAGAGYRATSTKYNAVDGYFAIHIEYSYAISDYDFTRGEAKAFCATISNKYHAHN